MVETLSQYGYVGIFLMLLGAGFGVPIPEELPVILAGIMVGHEDTTLRWYVMVPVLIAGVVLSDFVLYGAGRLWGRKLLDIGIVKRKIITPEQQEKLEKNFAEHGILVLLGVRLLPGIRAPVFVFAGILKVPLTRFVIADAIYAIPLVNALFWLAYVLTDQVLDTFNKLNEYKPLIAVAVLSGIAGVVIYKYVIGKRVTTGETNDVPAVISKPVEVIGHAVDVAVEKVEHAVEIAVEKVEHAVEKAVETVTGHHRDEKGNGAEAATEKEPGADDPRRDARASGPTAEGTPSAEAKGS